MTSTSVVGSEIAGCAKPIVADGSNLLLMNTVSLLPSANTRCTTTASALLPLFTTVPADANDVSIGSRVGPSSCSTIGTCVGVCVNGGFGKPLSEVSVHCGFNENSVP